VCVCVCECVSARLRDGEGLADARRLDEQVVERAFSRELRDLDEKVFPQRAANAAVAHLDDLFIAVTDENFIVDVFFAEFVFNDGDFVTVSLMQNAIEQRCFTGTQKASKYRSGNERHDLRFS